MSTETPKDGRPVGYVYCIEDKDKKIKFVQIDFVNGKRDYKLVDEFVNASIFPLATEALAIGKFLLGFGGESRGFVGQCLQAEDGIASVYEVAAIDSTMLKYIIVGTNKQKNRRVYLKDGDQYTERMVNAQILDTFTDALKQVAKCPQIWYKYDIVDSHIEMINLDMVSIRVGTKPMEFKLQLEETK